MVKKQIRKKSIRLNKNLKSETFVRTLARFEFTKLLGEAYNLAHWQTTINDTVDVIFYSASDGSYRSAGLQVKILSSSSSINVDTSAYYTEKTLINCLS